MLEAIVHLSSDSGKSSQKRYLVVFQRIQRRDRELADTFDDLRRSTDMRQLACMQSHELLGVEAFDCLSSQTGSAVQILGGASPVDQLMVGRRARLAKKCRAPC